MLESFEIMKLRHQGRERWKQREAEVNGRELIGC